MTQDIQIYIDNFRVDIATTSAIQIKKQFKDVKEYSKKKTSFSKPVTVLYTQNNASLFGAAFNINEVGGWDRNSRPVARVIVNGSTMSVDAAKLVSIDTEGYSFIVYKSETNLDTIFGDELIKGNADPLKDVSFTNQYDFNFTRPNLRTLMQGDVRRDGKGINYGYAEIISRSVDDIKEDSLMIPSIAAKELMEEILKEAGKTITFSTNILKYLNSIYIPFNSDYKELTNEWTYGRYYTNTAVMEEDITSNLFTIEDYQQDYDKIQTQSADRDLNTNRIPFINNVGEYKITLQCSVKKENQGTSNSEVKPKIIHRAGLYPYELTELDLINTGGSPEAGIILTDTNYHTETFEATFTTQTIGNSIYIGFESVDLPDGQGALTCSIDGSTNILTTKLDSYYNDDTPNIITADKILPVGYKKIDLFNDLALLFNARITSDEDNIIFESATEFNKDRNPIIKDWSDKVDESTISLSTLLSNVIEIESFKFAESDDLLNTKYRETYEAEISELARLEENKTSVTKSMASASTIRNNNFSSIIAEDEVYGTALKPRLLFAGTSNAIGLWGLDTAINDTSIVNLHILSNRFSEDTTTTDNLVLAFSNEFTYSDVVIHQKGTNGTIYNTFYKDNEAVSIDDDLMLLEAQFNLTPKDFAEIEFNDIIFIKTEKYGAAHYRLNEITNFRTGINKKTKVELIQIDLAILDAPSFESSEIDLKLLTL